MIKEIINSWEKNKNELENFFKTNRQEEYDTYKKIVKKIVEIIINDSDDCDDHYSNKIKVIDDGDYQGTQIFLIHKDTYQPGIEDYIYTSNYYGSCSGCDTLLAIQNYDDGLPTDEQVKDYMTLSLHLIQKFRKMNDKEEENNDNNK